MAMGVTVWDPQNNRILSAGRPADSTRTLRPKLWHLNRPNCEGDVLPERSGTLGPKMATKLTELRVKWAPGTLRNAR